MADVPDDSPMHQPEGSNDYGNEDFEKLGDIEPEQDEEVTTTSFTGEEAEEDRYVAGASQADQLIAFDDDPIQPSSQPAFAPIPEPFSNDPLPPPRQSGSPPPAYSPAPYPNDFDVLKSEPTSFEADTTSVKKELNTIMEPTEVVQPPEGNYQIGKFVPLLAL